MYFGRTEGKPKRQRDVGYFTGRNALRSVEQVHQIPRVSAPLQSSFLASLQPLLKRALLTLKCLGSQISSVQPGPLNVTCLDSLRSQRTPDTRQEAVSNAGKQVRKRARGPFALRVVQLNFTPEIEVLYMLFERSLCICSMTSL